ncbi:hypothetical protein CC2G_011292 [Coprinopsis cinerea AmutBmut pab1-1]|nr:hypothetical protein CC2G_011292 [Coprinopsis cinerea AmutBmut pab1-1]
MIYDRPGAFPTVLRYYSHTYVPGIRRELDLRRVPDGSPRAEGRSSSGRVIHDENNTSHSTFEGGWDCEVRPGILWMNDIPLGTWSSKSTSYGGGEGTSFTL